MISFTFAKGALALPFKVVYATIKYYTIGTEYTGLKSFTKAISACVYLHITNCATPQDVRLFQNYSLNDLLHKLSQKHIVNLNNIGKVYSDGPDGKSSWLVEASDRTPEDPVMVYIHGGGFLFQIIKNQVVSLISMYELLQNSRLSILIVDYSTTANKATFPIPLNQSYNVYDKLTLEGCNNVFLIGDSAGGNAVIGILRHIKHQKLTHPKASVLVSPWVTITPTKKGSYIENQDKDIIDFSALTVLGNFYCPDKTLSRSIEASPLNSKPQDRGEMEYMKKNTLVVYGAREVLRDDIAEWVEIAGIKSDNVVVDLKGIHDEFFMFDSDDDVEGFSEKFSVGHIYKFLHKYL